MNKENMIIVKKDGVDFSVYALGKLKLENGKEFMLYHLENDDNVQASHIVETDEVIELHDIAADDMILVQEAIDSILEGK